MKFIIHNRYRVSIALLTVYLIWGSIFLAIRIGLESFPPFFMLGIRFLISGSILYLFLRVNGVKTPSRFQWGTATIVGSLLLVCGNGGVAYAQQWVDSSLAALGMATVPLWATLFTGFWGKWPVKLEWVGLGLSFTGVGMLSLESNLWANPIGALSLFLASTGFAFGSVWSKHLPISSGLMTSAMQMLTGGGLLLLLSLISHEQISAFPTVKASLALMYLVIFGSLVAFSTYTYLLKKVQPALATSFTYVNPIIAVLLGVSFAGEEFNSGQILSMLIILLGVGLSALKRKDPIKKIKTVKTEKFEYLKFKPEKRGF